MKKKYKILEQFSLSKRYLIMNGLKKQKKQFFLDKNSLNKKNYKRMLKLHIKILFYENKKMQ